MMNKTLKKLCVTAILAMVLSFSIPANAETEDIANLDNQQISQETQIPTRMPYSKKALAMKFILAMLGVGASSVIIYVGLSIYNRFIYGTTAPQPQKAEDESFKTPNNMKDALAIFLRKTK